MNDAAHADPTQLTTLMKEAQKILTEDDPPAIFYGQSIYFTILSQGITGFVANPLYLAAYPFWSMSRTAS